MTKWAARALRTRPSAHCIRQADSAISSHDAASTAGSAVYASPTDRHSASANSGNSGAVLHDGSASCGDAASRIPFGNALSAPRRRLLRRRVVARRMKAARQRVGQRPPAHGRRQEPQSRLPRWQRSFLSFAYLKAPSGVFPQQGKLAKIMLYIQ